MIISRSERTFQAFNVVLMTVIGIVMVLPILHVIAQSLSDSAAINSGKVSFWPVDWTLGNYRLLVRDTTVWLGFRNSVIVAGVGTLINLIATASLAYPLSRSEYIGRKLILLLVLVTMIFHAPLIPNYLLLKQVHLLNTLWVLMIPTAISAFNLFVMRSFFINLPSELLDAAKIDGCGDFRVIWKIVLPLSKPALATMGIIYAVANWNTYSAAIYFIEKARLMPLQVRLMQIINADQYGQADITPEMMLHLSPEGLKMAVIVLAVLPIMLVYPFLQKHFIKGMLVGSVKS